MTETCEGNVNSNENELIWLLDSGCTDHIINNDTYYETFMSLTEPTKVKVGDGRILEATKVGNIRLNFKVYGSLSQILLKNVFFVKEMKANLLSYSKITQQHRIISQGNYSKIYDLNGILLAIAFKKDRLYSMKSFTLQHTINSNWTDTNKTITLKEKWHRKLGHVNFNYLDILCKNELLEGIPKEIETEYMKCQICIENKMHNLPFNNNRRRAENILDIVHTDLNGPHRTTGYTGEKYFLSFIDDYSKLGKLYCIQNKGQVIDCFKEYVNGMQNLTGKIIKEIRCDNGKE